MDDIITTHERFHKLTSVKVDEPITEPYEEGEEEALKMFIMAAASKILYGIAQDGNENPIKYMRHAPQVAHAVIHSLHETIESFCYLAANVEDKESK